MYVFCAVSPAHAPYSGEGPVSACFGRLLCANLDSALAACLLGAAVGSVFSEG